MSELKVELCPESGICSIIKVDGSKVDLMPDEVVSIRAAEGEDAVARNVISSVSADFADGLSAEEISEISRRVG
jgi:spore maturation protein SpmA